MTALDGLADVLAGVATPGVHQWPASVGVDDVRRRVEAAGWRYAHAAGPRAPEREQAMLAIGAALEFPSYFHGRSLDGLHDCLRDLTGPTVLLWDGWGGYAVADPDGFRRICRVLDIRDPGSPPLEVLLRGPATDLPSLG